MSYWYKKERPFGPDPFGIVKLGYTLISSKGPVEIGDFQQHFDPSSGKLFSRVSMYQLTLEVESLLTDDHTLSETFRIVEFPCPDAVFQCWLQFPVRTYSDKPLAAFAGIPGGLNVMPEEEEPAFEYHYRDRNGDFAGKGWSSVKILSGRGRVTHRIVNAAAPEIQTSICGLAEGDRLVRITTVRDSRDSAEWQDPMPHRRSCERVRTAAQEPNSRTRVSSASSFSCDVAEITRQFELSLYVVRASLHPGGSSVSCLAIPNGHSMGTYWDVWYTFTALIRTDRLAEARRIADFWRAAYPEARRVARDDYGLAGARFEWVLHSDGTPVYYSDQIHNNLIPVFILWEDARMRDDDCALADSFPLMRDAILFVIRYALKRDEDGKWYLRALTAVDESLQKKENELLTVVAAGKAMDLLAEAAQRLGIAVEPEIAAARTAFRSILATLKTARGYDAYQGADLHTWASIIACIHYPEPENFSQALEYALAGCRESHGLGMGRNSRMRCATWPWVEGIFAWAMARNRDSRVFEYLNMMNRYTDRKSVV